jgi:predicted ester cyclase
MPERAGTRSALAGAWHRADHSRVSSVPLEERLFALWAVPPDDGDDPTADFGELYADPVLINGVPISVPDLVARARALHSAFTEHDMRIVERIAEPGKLAIAFRHTARHTGPWSTPMGVLEPTGTKISGLGIDLLTVRDGRITEVWVLADELQRLAQVGALPG